MTQPTWGRDPLHPTPPPEVRLRRLLPEDAPRAAVLSGLIGWHQDAARWAQVINWGGRGCFCLESAGAIVATTIAIAYGQDRAWIAMVLTHPDHQRRGYASRLMRAALDYLGERQVQRVLLDATDAGRPLYEKLGFRPLYKVNIWAGRASDYAGPRARTLKSADLDAVIRFDAVVFGVARARIIRRMAASSPRLGWVIERGGGIAGYALAQTRGEEAHIGPWMAGTPGDAAVLLKTALSMLPGKRVRVDLLDGNLHAESIVKDHSFTRQRQCTRMLYGDAEPPLERIDQHYGVASLATG